MSKHRNIMNLVGSKCEYEGAEWVIKKAIVTGMRDKVMLTITRTGESKEVPLDDLDLVYDWVI